MTCDVLLKALSQSQLSWQIALHALALQNKIVKNMHAQKFSIPGHHRSYNTVLACDSLFF